MTQLEKTQSFLRENDGRSVARLESHCLALAQRLDAVMAAAEDAGWLGEPAIRAIVRANA